MLFGFFALFLFGFDVVGEAFRKALCVCETFTVVGATS